jgi:hypothetical protein
MEQPAGGQHLPADCWILVANNLSESLSDLASLRLSSQAVEAATRSLFLVFATQALFEDLDPSDASAKLIQNVRMSSSITHLRIVGGLLPEDEQTCAAVVRIGPL